MSGNFSTLFLVAIFAVFYLFIFLPQIRKNKKNRNYLKELKKGDSVITTGGIHGKISELKETEIILDAGGGIKLKISRSAINAEASQLLNT